MLCGKPFPLKAKHINPFIIMYRAANPLNCVQLLKSVFLSATCLSWSLSFSKQIVLCTFNLKMGIKLCFRLQCRIVLRAFYRPTVVDHFFFTHPPSLDISYFVIIESMSHCFPNDGINNSSSPFCHDDIQKMKVA